MFQITMARKRRVQKGSGLINSLIDALPFEAHIPGYKFAGPGTKLKQRLARGDVPVNGLDAAARDHDIAYSKTSDTKERNKADLALADRAWERVKAADSSLGERLAAYAVTNAMKLKAKLGAGVRRRRKRSTTRRGGAGIRKIGAGVRHRRRRTSGKKRGKAPRRKAAVERVIPRILPLPKEGGKVRSVLRRMGVAPKSITPTVRKIREVVGRKKSVKLGEGLFLKPFKKGYGLYLRPFRDRLN